MLAEDRYKKILSILEQQDSVKSSYLIKYLDVSVETVRRDLEHLEKEGLIRRVHGGAVLEEINSKPVSREIRKNTNNEQKIEIANCALDFIADGSSIAMDNGTTTLEIAKIIKDKVRNLTIITNSLAVVNELYDVDDYNLILLGGIVNNKDNSIAGNLTEKNIEMFHTDVSFVSVSGISIKNGISDFDFNFINIQRKFLEKAKQKIVLADSSKFGVISLMKICDFDKIDYIITDSKLKDALYNKYIQYGVEVIKPKKS